MKGIQARFVGAELYFDDLERARKFYAGTLGLEISDEQVGHHAKFAAALVLSALSGRGLSPIHRKTKVLFFEVPDLGAAIAAIGQDRLVQFESAWAVIHDPEGHNILLVQRSDSNQRGITD